jgi:hypothetical protein
MGLAHYRLRALLVPRGRYTMEVQALIATVLPSMFVYQGLLWLPTDLQLCGTGAPSRH